MTKKNKQTSTERVQELLNKFSNNFIEIKEFSAFKIKAFINTKDKEVIDVTFEFTRPFNASKTNDLFNKIHEYLIENNVRLNELRFRYLK